MIERALVVDDHPLVCEALALAISAVAPDLRVERAHSLGEMRAALRSGAACRLIALDLQLPDSQGFAGLIAARRDAPDARVVIVSGRQDAHAVRMAAAFDASGYIFKATPLADMQARFRRVLDGHAVFPPLDGCEDDGELGAARVARIVADLSAAQLRVLTALADGRPTKLVAHDLGLTEAGVKAQLTTLFREFQVVNRSQLLLAARSLLEAAPAA